MVKINSSQQTIKTTFPSIKGSKVELKDSLSAADFEQAVASKGDIQIIAVSLQKMILSWNLEDDDGKPLEVSTENIKKIDVMDLREVFANTSFAKRVEEMEKKTEA